MDVTPILEPLNEQQRKAVTAEKKPLLVIAGAGSGKTRVLTHRIAWLIKIENLSPHNLMAVTFTNKAAKEMRDRIETLLGIPVNNLWIGTCSDPKIINGYPKKSFNSISHLFCCLIRKSYCHQIMWR